MPVTMRDVAQKVGVSKQTVSAVLNGKPGISADTIARIQQAIIELGYQPNLVASSLRHGQTNTIGLLLDNVANPWFAALAQGVEDVAQARGYSVIFCNTYGEPARITSSLQMLTRQRIAGVIGITATDAQAAVPTTSCIFQPLFATDDRRGGYVATAHLLDLGHRRIGCVTAPAETGTAHERLAGYKAALSDWGIAVEENLIVEGTLDYASGLRAIDHLLKHNRQSPPTAIFAHQDLLAIGIIAGLKRAGLRVPEDIAVIGYDDLEIAALYDPPLSSINYPVYAMGMRGMTQLANTLEGLQAEEPAPLDCTLVVRRSTVAHLDQEWVSAPIAQGTPWRGWHTANNL